MIPLSSKCLFIPKKSFTSFTRDFLYICKTFEANLGQVLENNEGND